MRKKLAEAIHVSFDRKSRGLRK